MYKAFKYSLALHALLIIVFLFKIPDFHKESNPETVVTVDIVKTSETTNLKNKSKSPSNKKKPSSKTPTKKIIKKKSIQKK